MVVAFIQRFLTQLKVEVPRVGKKYSKSAYAEHKGLLRGKISEGHGKFAERLVEAAAAVAKRRNTILEEAAVRQKKAAESATAAAAGSGSGSAAGAGAAYNPESATNAGAGGLAAGALAPAAAARSRAAARALRAVTRNWVPGDAGLDSNLTGEDSDVDKDEEDSDDI